MSAIVPAAIARRLAAPACAVVVSVMLAACGGGGGDSPPAPPSPVASLAIDAAATSTASSGAAVPLHAVLANSTATPTWTLSGPGSLSAGAGSDVIYTPPDAETFAQAATAMITAQAGGLTSTISIAVAIGGKPGLHWQAVHAYAPAWAAVAYGDGKFLAVGENGATSVSADGQTWARHDAPPDMAWAALTYGPSGWVGVSVYGIVATSADGVQWTFAPAPLPGADDLISVSGIAFGNGVYLVTSWDASWTSSDAVHWTRGPVAIDSIAFGGGRFVAVDVRGYLLASVDGRTWNAVYPGRIFQDVAFGNGRFVARYDSDTTTSTDGLTWTADTPVNDLQGVLLSTGDGFLQSAGTETSFLNGVRSDDNILVTSTDGVAWAYHHQTPVTRPKGAARGAGHLVVVSGDGSIASGADVDHLQAAVAASAGTLVAADYVNGRYQVLSSEGNLLSSVDGQAWTTIGLAPIAWPWQPATYLFNSLMAHAASGRMVMLSSTYPAGAPVAVYSDDGSNWRSATTPTATPANVVYHDGTRFVALAGGDVYTSEDGDVWALMASIPLATTQTPVKATHGNGRQVVVGTGGLVASSADGVHWTVGDTVHAQGDASAALDLFGVTFVGNRFVAVGARGTVAVSADGQAWTVSTSATTASLNAIAASPDGEMVAVGAIGLAETSVDGVHWTLRDTPNADWMVGVVYGNGAFLSVGERGFIAMSSH